MELSINTNVMSKSVGEIHRRQKGDLRITLNSNKEKKKIRHVVTERYLSLYYQYCNNRICLVFMSSE